MQFLSLEEVVASCLNSGKSDDGNDGRVQRTSTCSK